MCLFTHSAHTKKTVWFILKNKIPSGVTRCPTMCGTAQHFNRLSHVPHIEVMSRNLTGSSLQSQTTALKFVIYPVAVKKRGAAQLSSPDWSQRQQDLFLLPSDTTTTPGGGTLGALVHQPQENQREVAHCKDSSEKSKSWVRVHGGDLASRLLESWLSIFGTKQSQSLET